MNIIISNKVNSPIYEQIEKQIKTEIMKGNLKAGDSLPSMRQLAKELHISVITAQRAYEDLQRDGYIETTAGKGSFVTFQSVELAREEQYQQLETHLEAATNIAHRCGVNIEKLQELLKMFYFGG